MEITKKDIEFKNIKFNSKDILKDDIFISYYGKNQEKNILEAISKNASLIITNINYKHEKVAIVKNLNKKLIFILDRYYNYPLKNKKLIGVCGTDGKTTITSILSDLLSCPSIGTNGFILNNKEIPLNNTTPSVDVLYECFKEMKNVNHIVMEVSSEAYLTNRLGDLKYDLAIFTNITKEHLDKHKTFNNYLNCKLRLFKNSKISILNRDSKYYYKFKDNSNNSFSYGFKLGSDLRILSYKLYYDKTIMYFKYQGKKYKTIYPLLGKFNVYNVAACILAMLTLGFKIDFILEKLEKINQVKGRMEFINNQKYQIVIDYAHTTNATKAVLKYFSKFNKNIITIVGCAGGRYNEKRKEIGKLVLKYSKLVIFTSDDPRYENPINIIYEMINNIKKDNYLIIINRSLAIKFALSICKKDNLVLILGKGRDNYMLIENKKIVYSDYNTIMNLLK